MSEFDLDIRIVETPVQLYTQEEQREALKNSAACFSHINTCDTCQGPTCGTCAFSCGGTCARDSACPCR